MDTQFAICGKDWVIVVADTGVNRSIFNLTRTDEKICHINQFKVLGATGEQTDRYQF